MLLAIVSGILEGSLIAIGILDRNPFALIIAGIFFYAQWRYLGRK